MDIAEVVNSQLPGMQELMHMGHVVAAKLTPETPMEHRFVFGATYGDADHYLLVELSPDFRIKDAYTPVEDLFNMEKIRYPQSLGQNFTEDPSYSSPRFKVEVSTLGEKAGPATYYVQQELLGLAGAGTAANLYTFLTRQDTLPGDRDFTFLSRELPEQASRAIMLEAISGRILSYQLTGIGQKYQKEPYGQKGRSTYRISL